VVRKTSERSLYHREGPVLSSDITRGFNILRGMGKGLTTPASIDE
jgi:hypothetical protein